jgi:L-xylulose reductase
MKIDFQNKSALVTGASSGIGREIARTLAGCNARVIAVGRSQERLDSLKSEIDCQTIQVDLLDAEATRTAISAAGEIELLVNCAGITILESFLDTTLEAFDQVLGVNLRASLIVGQIVARGMVARGKGGAIVNMSSQASVVALAEHTSYCASKGAIDQLTRVMALELGPHNIRVNAVNPTVTLTDMAVVAWSDPAKRDPMLAKIPLGKFAQPSDVAHTVAYLLSDYADMIHGAMIPIDGGFLAT